MTDPKVHLQESGVICGKCQRDAPTFCGEKFCPLNLPVDAETPIQFVPGLEVPSRQNCGPWDQRADGLHACRKCGRLDPLDLQEFGS